ncbi:MAG: hypothetical protein ACREMG_13140, partial [Gemmatimonadales bacterium]
MVDPSRCSPPRSKARSARQPISCVRPLSRRSRRRSFIGFGPLSLLLIPFLAHAQERPGAFLWHRGGERTTFPVPLDLRGADGVTDAADDELPDDPGRYTLEGFPWNRANPFRGRLTPSGNQRFHERDVDLSDPGPSSYLNLIGRPQTPGLTDPFRSATYIDPLDPRLLAVLDNPALRPSGFPIPQYFAARTNTFYVNPGDPNGANLVPTGLGVDPFGSVSPELFGGDYSGIVPCVRPDNTTGQPGDLQRRGSPGGGVDLRFCNPDGSPVDPSNPLLGGTGSNTRIMGGAGELPMRPAPDRGNLDCSPNSGGAAQGLHFPFPAG